jgi:hypothetical protein
VITAPGTAPIAFAAAIFRAVVPDQEAVTVEFERQFAREHAAAH